MKNTSTSVRAMRKRRRPRSGGRADASLRSRRNASRFLAKPAIRANVELEFFKHLFEGAPDAALVSRGERIVLVNAQFETMFGYHREELLGESIEVLLPERFREQDGKLLTHSGAAPRMRSTSASLNLFGKRKDGNEFPVDMMLSPLETEEGSFVLAVVRDATKNKQVEETIRQNEERFRIALLNSPIVVFNQDRELRYTWIFNSNPPSLADSMLGRTDAQLFSPEEAALLTRIKRRVLATGENAREEVLVTVSGEVVLYDLVVEPLYDSAGGIVGISCAAIDITKRKRAEEAQRRSEELFRTAFAQASVGLAITDSKGRFVQVNKAYSAMTGFPEKELCERDLSSITHPDDLLRYAQSIGQLLAGETGSFVNQQRYIRKSGDIVWVQNSVSAIRDAGGDTVNFIVLTENITEHKRTEDERALLATIVESSEDAIIGRKLDGTIISWNAGAERIFGYRAEEAIGRFYSFLVPPDRPNELDEIREKIKRGERVEHYESVRLAKGGKLVDISLTVSPIKDARGALVGLSVVGRDITTRKRGEAERSRLMYQLGERIKELTAMYGVAHLLQMEGKSVMALLEEIASLLPPAWQYPKVAAARIQLGELEFKTPKFHPSHWSQQAGFTTADGRKGKVEVVYLAECPPDAEGPFSTEERNLIDAVAENLKVYLDRKHLESEILEISEREQRRVGQDLHDGLSQQLRGIAYLSHVLAEDLGQKSLSGAKDASRITQLLNQAILEAHGLAQGLFPISLEAEGLMSALKELASNIRNIYKISCRLMCPKPVLIDDSSIAMNLFRIVQEAIQNAIKHGKATRIVIRLTKKSEDIELAVKDNGRGLPKHFETRQGMGLKIMDHRASMIGAALQVHRVAAGGTLLTCSLRSKRDKLSKSKV